MKYTLNPMKAIVLSALTILSSCTLYAQGEFITTWKTDNSGTSSDTEITIPTFPGETYDYEVDWDYNGTFTADDSGVTGDMTHDYGVAGTYTVAIRGTFPRIYFNGTGDEEKILTVEQWGDQVWSSFENAFQGCDNLNITNSDIDTPDLSNCTSLASAFRSCSAFDGDITQWNVSTISNFDEMFANAEIFNQNIGMWNVSSGETFIEMFGSAEAFDQPIGSWNVSSAIEMIAMFESAESFNQDLNGWVFTQIEDLSGMFRSAASFNGDISGWNVSTVRDMGNLFDRTPFNQDISGWDVSNVENMQGMFGFCEFFNQDIGGWDVSNVENMSGMLEGTDAFNQNIGMWNVGNVSNFASMFRNAGSFDQNLGSWDISSTRSDAPPGQGMWRMFDRSSMSLVNYDNTLIGWNTDDSGIDGDGIDDIPQMIEFDGGDNVYCVSETARQNLIDTHGWDIDDDGLTSCEIWQETTNACTEVVQVDLSGSENILIRDSNDRILCSINPNGNDLGNTTITIYRSFSQRDVTNPSVNRDITIVPTNQPSSPVSLELYYLLDEWSGLLEELSIFKTDDNCTGTIPDMISQIQTVAQTWGDDNFILSGDVLSFSTFFGLTDAALPVELLSFHAALKGQSTDISWTTTEEINNSHFEIERSLNGIQFKSIGTVYADERDSQIKDYRFMDYYPESGKNYYRLKQVDLDGSYNYSPIVVVDMLSDVEEISLFPNPATTELSIANTQAGDQILIYDAKNQLINTYEVQHELSTIDISALDEGIYHVVIHGIERHHVSRFMKRK